MSKEELAIRAEVLPGQTYKILWPGSEHAIYVTINNGEDGKTPFELFINSKNMDHYAWSVALTRMVSAVFRRGGDITFVVEELKSVFDPQGGQWMNGRYVPSLLAAIGFVIERHIKGPDVPLVEIVERETSAQAKASLAVQKAYTPPVDKPKGKACPKCGAPSLVKSEGCEKCMSCEYSKCG